MPLLTKAQKLAFTTKPSSSSSSNDSYFNPASVDDEKKARFTILGDDSLGGYQLFVEKKDGGFTVIRWAEEPTEREVAARVEEQGCRFIPNRKTTPQQFYAVPVWNYDRDYGKDEDKPNPGIQVACFTQRSIIDPLINALSDDEISQDASVYDFVMGHNDQSVSPSTFFADGEGPGRRVTRPWPRRDGFLGRGFFGPHEFMSRPG